MAAYMAQRIIDGAYTFLFVTTKRPDLQAGIETYLTAQGREDLIE
ncbi:hypothetical protein [Mesobacillus zeae]|nr:hypothetical protein [Mesobacillus zeae]